MLFFLKKPTATEHSIVLLGCCFQFVAQHIAAKSIFKLYSHLQMSLLPLLFEYQSEVQCFIRNIILRNIDVVTFKFFYINIIVKIYIMYVYIIYMYVLYCYG